MRAAFLVLALLVAPLLSAQTDTTAVAPTEPAVEAPVAGSDRPTPNGSVADEPAVEERTVDEPVSQESVADAPETVVYTAPREVALGYVLGYLFPGAGHYYAGEVSTGAMLTATVVAGYALAVTTVFRGNLDCSDVSCDYNPPVAALAGFGLVFGASIYSVVDGGRAVRRTNRANGFAAAPRTTIAPQGAGLAMRVRL